MSLSKEGPDDDVKIAKVSDLCLERLIVDITIERVLCLMLRFMFYVLCFIILEGLVVNMTIDRVYVLCFLYPQKVLMMT